MSERTDAIKLARRILDNPLGEANDDLALLSRQFLRAVETIEKMHKRLQEVDWNGQAELDLIHANRDEILKRHQEAVGRIAKAAAVGNLDLIMPIIKALWLFHPMHEWQGWPEGS